MKKITISTTILCYFLFWGLLLSLSSAFADEGSQELHDPIFLQEAIRSVLQEREDTGATPTDSTLSESELAPPAASVAPPAGASHHQPGQQAVPVTGTPQRLKRSESKPSAGNGGVGYLSSSSSQNVADEWRKVAFSSGSFVPPTGVDSRMLSEISALQAKGQKFVYGFILMNEYLSEETQREIEALGVTILDPHSDVYKAKFPLDAIAMEQIAELPYVEWIGYSKPEQKLDVELQQMVKEGGETETSDQLPIVINLFDDDSDGVFKDQLEAAGATPGRYDPDLFAYYAVASKAAINQIVLLDFVLFVEPIRQQVLYHDQSMAAIGADYIRPGASGTTFDADQIPVGIMDTGFMLGSAASTTHQDLNKNGCGHNFTSDNISVWDDQHGHGTHVLGTLCGTGTADNRYRGVAIGVGSIRIRAAKVFRAQGSSPDSWINNAMDWMDDSSACNSPRPMVINYSGGSYDNSPLNGTDSKSRKLDSKVWSYKQVYVIAAGNYGSGSKTVGSPGVAKNALTVGNVFDNGYLTIGDIDSDSSRGPTGDGRMKPNVVAPGNWITSARAGTTNQYTGMSGTSMATPHVTGLVATLMEHYSAFQWNPALLRAFMMATSILHDDDTTPDKNTYGLGRVTSYLSHWARNNSNGWVAKWFSGTVTSSRWEYSDIEIPTGTDRLVVVMTWDESAASAGASKAVKYDLDLWIDYNRDCTSDSKGQCGEWASQSYNDNVEYIIINNPSAGWYRFKVCNWNAPSSGLPYGVAVNIIRGDPSPSMNFTTTANPSRPQIGDTFIVTTKVSPSSYIASGVHLTLTNYSSGLTLQKVETTREDGVTMDFRTANNLTLGNIHEGDNRFVTWTFRANTGGTKTLNFRAWSENGGTANKSVTVTVPVPYVLLNDTPVSFSDIPKDFTFNVKNYDWCGVAIHPSRDHDIKADNTADLDSPYASSTYGSTVRDFVATNGHRWGDATHYAQVYYGSSGSYTIEAEWEAHDLSVGNSLSDAITNGEVIQVYEASLTSGKNYLLGIDVTSGTANVSVAVFKPSRSAGSRADSDWFVNTNGSGGDESLSFTADTTGDYGIVVINENNGAANYNISVKVADSGDINHDGAIDTLDLQLLVNCLIRVGSCDGSDLNGDGYYNIFDLQLLVNKILNP